MRRSPRIVPERVESERESLPEVILIFRFYGDDFEPDEITRRLEIKPTKIWRAGDPRGDPGSGATSPRSGWWVELEPRKTHPISGLLEELRRRIDIAGPLVRQMCDDLQLTPHITCVIYQPRAASTPIVDFPPDFMAWAVSLGASIGVDLYILD
jgi:hypothetical protein